VPTPDDLLAGPPLEAAVAALAERNYHHLEQMNDAERRQYLSESLFLNTVSYENERLGAYMRKLNKKK